MEENEAASPLTFDEEENETEEQVGQAKGNLPSPN
jgi:hypothetical protein